MNALNSFSALIDTAADFAANKHDSVAPARSLSFTPDGRLTVPNNLFGGALSLGLEDLAISQLAGRLGPTFWDASKRTIPSDFYKHLNRAYPAHFASLTNDLLGGHDGNLLVRGYGDDARAILSDSYARLDNSEVLDMASQVLDGLPYQIVESGKYFSKNDGVQRDEMAIRVVVKHVKPGDENTGYGLGVLIRNGETGGAASEIRPLIMRTSCMNSLVFKQGEAGEDLGLRLTHRGVRAAKLNLMASAIAEALPMAEDNLVKYLNTRTAKIDLAGVIAKLGEDHGWSEDMSLAVGVGSEGHQSVYGLINGLTFAAHEMEINQAERIEIESMASTFVHKPQLARLAK